MLAQSIRANPLMHRAGEATYEEAKDCIQYREIEGTKIPFLKPELPIQTKQTVARAEASDRMFLEYLPAQQPEASAATAAQPQRRGFRRFLKKLFKSSTTQNPYFFRLRQSVAGSMPKICAASS